MKLVGSSPTCITKYLLIMTVESRKIECLKLTLDYQLGLYVGLEIVNRYLPTLQTK